MRFGLILSLFFSFSVGFVCLRLSLVWYEVKFGLIWGLVWFTFGFSFSVVFVEFGLLWFKKELEFEFEFKFEFGLDWFGLRLFWFGFELKSGLVLSWSLVWFWIEVWFGLVDLEEPDIVFYTLDALKCLALNEEGLVEMSK